MLTQDRTTDDTLPRSVLSAAITPQAMLHPPQLSSPRAATFRSTVSVGRPATASERRPREILLWDGILRRPLRAEVEREGERGWIVVADEVASYGFGRTFEEARAEFLSMLQDYRSELEGSVDQLAPHLRQHLLRLRELLG